MWEENLQQLSTSWWYGFVYLRCILSWFYLHLRQTHRKILVDTEIHGFSFIRPVKWCDNEEQTSIIDYKQVSKYFQPYRLIVWNIMYVMYYN